MTANVVLIIYNRPDLTAEVFSAIARVRPARLFVIADGPKPERPGDAELVQLTRRTVADVDWECEVVRNYAETNIGCRARVTSGMNMVFGKVDDAIVLEDDCVPHPSFFRFCRELLDRYRDDSRVFHIGGDNFQRGKKWGNASYYFSKYTHGWGWATWRRAWQFFDSTIRDWPEFRDSGGLKRICPIPQEEKYWFDRFEEVYAGRPDIWDFAWNFACWQRQSLAIVPQVNLVSNIGFRADAMHTREYDSFISSLPAQDIGRIVHPEKMERNDAADRRAFWSAFVRRPPAWRRFIAAITNRYTYGKLIREMPLIGSLWARYRQKRKQAR